MQSKQSSITQQQTTHYSSLVSALATCPVDRYMRRYVVHVHPPVAVISVLLHKQQPNANSLQRMQCSCSRIGSMLLKLHRQAPTQVVESPA
jgi:hypothetical protein